MAKETETAATEPAKPDIFARHSIKTTLLNRIMRALKDAPDDEMRRQIIQEVAAFNNFKPE